MRETLQVMFLKYAKKFSSSSYSYTEMRYLPDKIYKTRA